jgi:hypothetical protein
MRRLAVGASQRCVREHMPGQNRPSSTKVPAATREPVKISLKWRRLPGALARLLNLPRYRDGEEEAEVLSGQELWSAIIALLLVPLVYLVRTIVDEAAREDAPSWRWGERRRRASAEPTWGRHEFCVIGTALAVLAALEVLT